MMKFKTTGKQIRENYHSIVGTGHCTMQSLLTFQSPIAYSSGVYGWNCDYYILDGIVVCTGYRSIVSQHTKKIDYKTLQDYENRAQAINNSRTLSYEERKTQVNNLLSEYLNTLKT